MFSARSHRTFQPEAEITHKNKNKKHRAYMLFLGYLYTLIGLLNILAIHLMSLTSSDMRFSSGMFELKLFITFIILDNVCSHTYTLVLRLKGTLVLNFDIIRNFSWGKTKKTPYSLLNLFLTTSLTCGKCLIHLYDKNKLIFDRMDNTAKFVRH